MGNWVRENTCGSCADFEFEKKKKKGYCKRYRAYYWPDDSCSHWESDGTFSSGSSGCFLTSACCDYKGLADNCDELETMRAFRDSHLKSSESGRRLVDLYYKEAPKIVERINGSINKNQTYEWMWSKIQLILRLIRNGENEDATIEYVMMMYLLSNIETLPVIT